MASVMGNFWDGSGLAPVDGHVLLGRLSPATLANLQETLVPAAHALIRYESMDLDAEDRLFHPSAPGGLGDAMAGYGPAPDFDSNELQTLMPWKNLDICQRTLMGYDYLQQHCDLCPDSTEMRGVVFLVLDAPLGCNFVVNGVVYELQPGDVVLFDDMTIHGMFPIRPPAFYRDSRSTEHDPDREAFARDNCFSVLRITHDLGGGEEPVLDSDEDWLA
ncbi:hypothetical protein HNP46_000437 [Pseudomonas nitritireducens]|uniref:Aspartyl/asparaginy/proline hydroxylase domain-containing protein n=1 Tax=Pseudomonas nitroreducens TaxID=46680 RepID=A0A7W7KEZ3_PSENT|nr:aspartyl/asparaginyl beta-hydroxylase domain-containing protein [Pseudomonas nitritireducens]MBB4861626.1 hypothetical protein [Pseudomonas nitritireducens]